jgi:hypothetical protein
MEVSKNIYILAQRERSAKNDIELDIDMGRARSVKKIFDKNENE